MRMRTSWIGVMAAALAACGVFGAEDPPAGTTPEAEKAKAEENANSPVGGPPLDGIFVSSSKGNDSGSGSMGNPVKTLARALALGKERTARVIACAEEFRETLVLVDGVSAFGYYDCTQTPWVQVETRARVASTTSPAATAQGITLTTKLEGFEIFAPNLDGAPATDDEGTSIALDVRESKGLVVSQSLLHSGKGAPGIDGVPGPFNERTKTSNGTIATDQAYPSCIPSMFKDCSKQGVPGPAGGVTTCTIGPPGGPGGKGGDGRWYANGVESPTAAEFRGLPLAASAATAMGGLNEQPDGKGKGLPGAKGARGAAGSDGTNGVWFLTAFGFVRGNGTAGGIGEVGQGGGGGGGARTYFSDTGTPNVFPAVTYFSTATGGSGGAGGCAGQPGTPATGGGASIGAFLIKSSVTFDHTRIESSAGGRAGLGNLGTVGSTGGDGGLGTSHGVPTTGQGGDGGSGGPGGASGHGAPGPSIAIAYSEKPTLTQVDLAPGPGGQGQPELSAPVTVTTNRTLPAVLGESKAEHVIKL
jgi:hypothetical protein